MDTDSLRWFAEVADGVTVTEVSELARTSQPGVSRALARLEAEVGTSLLRRSGRTLRMTHAGTVFKHHVDALIHQLDDGLAAVQQIIDPETGTVTLAYEPWLGSWWVPALVADFRAVHPDVRFDLKPKRAEAVTTVRSRGDIDLEVSTLRPSSASVGWHRLVREPLYLAVASHHPLAVHEEVVLADLAGERFIALGERTLLREVTDDVCAQARFEPEVVFECEDIDAIRGFIAAGLGVSIVPRPHQRQDTQGPHQVRYLVINDVSAAREIGVAWSTERRLLPASELFLAHLRDGSDFLQGRAG
ncbi:MAG: LysR family transcriptional regulator [Ornithinimicrobium sp.]